MFAPSTQHELHRLVIGQQQYTRDHWYYIKGYNHEYYVLYQLSLSLSLFRLLALIRCNHANAFICCT